MVRGPVTEGIASETPISTEGMGIGNGTVTSELVAKFGASDEGDKRQDRERSNGVDGAEGVSSGSGLSEVKEKVSPRPVRRSANKGEMLGESPARFIIRRNTGIRRLNK